MTQFIFTFLYLMMFAGISLGSTNEMTEEIIIQQTFSKAHVEARVTESQVARLKEIDITNPLFIYK